MINFDNNATAELTPCVIDGLRAAVAELWGNPSSEHLLGKRSRGKLESARSSVAGLLGSAPENIVFTSGATEANNLVLKGVASRWPSGHFVSTTVEHPSILNSLEALKRDGRRVIMLPVGSGGEVSISDLRGILDRSVRLVSVQWVNNETGIVQPIEAISKLCQDQGVALHVDAAQAFGRMKIDIEKTKIDFLSVSGHKIHAPMGVGALFVRDKKTLVAQLDGGDQEHRLRPGTENLLGIYGFGLASLDRLENFDSNIKVINTLRTIFEQLVKENMPWVEIVGEGSPRIGNTSCVSFRGIDGQALAARLNDKGLLCSQSSACSSRRPEPSHVLRAMGFSEKDAYSCIRFSFSILNNEDEINRSIEIINESTETAKMFAWG